MHKFVTTAGAIAMIAASAATAVPAFAGQTGRGPGAVFNCDAQGNRQAYGAVLGAIGGAIVGNNVSHGKDAPVVGALAGAAAGSYIGCQQQNDIAAREGRGNAYATTTVNVRRGPSTRYQAVDRLYRGEQVYIGAYDGNWAHVYLPGGREGYVAAAYLQPAGR